MCKNQKRLKWTNRGQVIFETLIALPLWIGIVSCCLGGLTLAITSLTIEHFHHTAVVETLETKEPSKCRRKHIAKIKNVLPYVQVVQWNIREQQNLKKEISIHSNLRWRIRWGGHSFDFARTRTLSEKDLVGSRRFF